MGKKPSACHWEQAQPFGQVFKLKGAVIGSVWPKNGVAYAEFEGTQKSFPDLNGAKLWVERQAERSA